MKSQAHQDFLMQSVHFTEEDLLANRAGELSERQRAYLTVDRRKNTYLGIVLVVLFVIGTAGLLFWGIRDENRILQILGVVLMFCNAGITYGFGANWVRASFDLKTNRVEAIEGTTQHVVRQFGRAQAGSVRVGDTVEIPTKPELFKAFEPNATYRLYRTSHTQRLLSVEKV